MIRARRSRPERWCTHVMAKACTSTPAWPSSANSPKGSPARTGSSSISLPRHGPVRCHRESVRIIVFARSNLRAPANLSVLPACYPCGQFLGSNRSEAVDDRSVGEAHFRAVFPRTGGACVLRGAARSIRISHRGPERQEKEKETGAPNHHPPNHTNGQEAAIE